MPQLIEEIFSVGKWNGVEFSLSDLRQIELSFTKLMGVLKVPLKFGHNEDQAITDGQPALGFVSQVYVNDKTEPAKLMGVFEDVPEIVFSAINSKRYTQKSIELDFDVVYKDVYYKYVLTGVALLGADLPAVNTLNDLGAYLSRRNNDKYEATKCLTFVLDNREGESMSDDMKTQLAELKAKLAAVEADKESEHAKFDREKAEWLADKEKAEQEAKKQAFIAKRDQFKTELESAVKDKSIFPAQRDELLKDIENEDVLAARIYTMGIIKKSPGGATPGGNSEVGGTGGTGGDSKRPDEEILNRISEAQAKSPELSFARAKAMVMKADPKLARSYIHMNEA
jgi:hypothetical protein